MEVLNHKVFIIELQVSYSHCWGWK